MAISERKLDLINRLVREHCLKYTELNVIIDNSDKGIRYVYFYYYHKLDNTCSFELELKGLDRGVITKITVTIPRSTRTNNSYKEQHVFTAQKIFIHSSEVTAQKIIKDIDEIMSTMRY